MARQYVGIDLHRRRSVIVRKNDAGEVLSTRRIDNDPLNLAAAVREAGESPEVILEATYGWYWAADVLAELGCDVHLAAPSWLNWGQRRVKNDVRDAIDLIDLHRLGRMTEAWIAPPRTRELRELVRYRLKLTGLRTGLKAQLHAVMAKNGVLPARNDMFGPGGRAQLAALDLPAAYKTRIESIQRVVDVLSSERRAIDTQLRRELRDDPGYRAVQVISGVGPLVAAVFVAEIGDVTRFPSPQQLCSWAGLTPKHRESDTKVMRGKITKQGSRLVRWAAIEAISKQRGGATLRADFNAIAARRGKQKANVAVARKLLTLVYYGLRDHEIRCLQPAA
jgi:transposase